MYPWNPLRRLENANALHHSPDQRVFKEGCPHVAKWESAGSPAEAYRAKAGAAKNTGDGACVDAPPLPLPLRHRMIRSDPPFKPTPKQTPEGDEPT
jgi:hypothetical protein